MANDVKQSISQPIVQPIKRNHSKVIFLIGGLIFVVVTIISLFIFIRRKGSITKFSPTPTPSAKSEINVPIETKYENPFDDKTQYENPFSNNTNPFDNLK